MLRRCFCDSIAGLCARSGASEPLSLASTASADFRRCFRAPSASPSCARAGASEAFPFHPRVLWGVEPLSPRVLPVPDPGASESEPLALACTASADLPLVLSRFFRGSSMCRSGASEPFSRASTASADLPPVFSRSFRGSPLRGYWGKGVRLTGRRGKRGRLLLFCRSVRKRTEAKIYGTAQRARGSVPDDGRAQVPEDELLCRAGLQRRQLADREAPRGGPGGVLVPKARRLGPGVQAGPVPPAAWLRGKGMGEEASASPAPRRPHVEGPPQARRARSVLRRPVQGVFRVPHPGKLVEPYPVAAAPLPHPGGFFIAPAPISIGIAATAPEPVPRGGGQDVGPHGPRGGAPEGRAVGRREAGGSSRAL